MSVQPHRRLLRNSWNAVVMLAAIALIAVWIVLPNGRNFSGASATGRSSWRPQTGGPQLVSIQPFPAMEGAICEWMPASATATASASLTAHISLSLAKLLLVSSSPAPRRPLGMTPSPPPAQEVLPQAAFKADTSLANSTGHIMC